MLWRYLIYRNDERVLVDEWHVDYQMKVVGVKRMVLTTRKKKQRLMTVAMAAAAAAAGL